MKLSKNDPASLGKAHALCKMILPNVPTLALFKFQAAQLLEDLERHGYELHLQPTDKWESKPKVPF